MNAPQPINTTAETFLNDVIERSKETPVLVDFWADWCGPCKQLMPILDRLFDDYAGRFLLAKVNTDEQQALAQQIGVRSLPTVVLFKDGQVADHFVGVVPEKQIRDLLDKHVPPPAAAPISPLDQVRTLKANQQWTEARSLLTSLLEQDPKNIALLCELAELDVFAGDMDAAKAQLLTLQAQEPKAAAVKRLAALIEFNEVIRANPDADALKLQLKANDQNIDARHALAVHRLLAGDYDVALLDWLEILRAHRKTHGDLARKSLLMAFEMLGSNEPIVAQTRREMAQLVF